ncbi:MAG: hypothetical protein CVT77_18750 [Alphaproteobacteria bacterium HGW-Alphaproteobacteria-16]|nr:MAG: hypothetical protein CVT77_18750 [Alphaproteobacteria bacterium HGW-Alphaproteobacteria-16]
MDIAERPKGGWLTERMADDLQPGRCTDRPADEWLGHRRALRTAAQKARWPRPSLSGTVPRRAPGRSREMARRQADPRQNPAGGGHREGHQRQTQKGLLDRRASDRGRDRQGDGGCGMSAPAGWQKGSFRGVPFVTREHEASGGRRLVSHEFPQADLPVLEDLGKRAKLFVLDCYVLGADHIDQANRLADALEAAGAGTLIQK